MFAFLANQVKVAWSHLVQTSTAAAGAINGTGVDIANAEGPILVSVNSVLMSTADTITFTVQHSEDNTSFAAVPAAALVNPDTGDAATFTVGTDAVAVAETLALRRDLLKRYVRVVATTAGTTITAQFSSFLTLLKKTY